MADEQDFVRREVEKAFSMIDRDGSGQLSKDELRGLIRSIRKHEVSEVEVNELIDKMDKDCDGQISKNEFTQAITDWLSGEATEAKYTYGGSKRKRNQERQEIHKRIKRFFGDLRPDQTLDEMRSKVILELEDSKRCFEMRLSGNQMQNVAESSEKKEKMEAINKTREFLSQFDSIAIALHSDNPQTLMIGTGQIRAMLSLVEIFPTSTARRTFASIILEVFQVIVQKNIQNRLMDLLNYPHADIQLNACTALTYFAAGPRLAGVPESSPANINSPFWKSLLGPDFLVRLLERMSSPLSDFVIHQVLLCFGVMTSTHPAYRNYAISREGIPTLVRVWDRFDKVPPILQAISRCLSILCGVTHPLNELPPHNAVMMVLQIAANLLKEWNDDEIKCNALEALKLYPALLHNAFPELQYLVTLIGSTNEKVQESALETITILVQSELGTSSNCYRFLTRECSLLSGLGILLKQSSLEIRKKVLGLLRRIAERRDRISDLCQAEIPVVVVRLLDNDKEDRVQAVKFLYLMSRGHYEEVGYLVKIQAVKVLAESLRHFKCYDEVLQSVYEFSGASFEFEFVEDVLSTLTNIMNTGVSLAHDTHQGNPFGIAFNMEVLDRLIEVVNLLFREDSHELQAWRQQESGRSLEEQILDLLQKIHRSHRGIDNPRSSNICQRIKDTWKTYFSGSQDTHQPTKKIIRLAFKDEPVVIEEIKTDIPYQELFEKIKTRYERPMSLTYRSKDGLETSIDSDVSLREAIEQYKTEHAIKIQLTENLVLAPKHDIESEFFDWSESWSQKPQDLRMSDFADKIQDEGKASALFPEGFNLQKVDVGDFFSMEDDLKMLQGQDQNLSLSDLQQKTHYSIEELRKVWDHWKSLSGKDGKLTKSQFGEGMKQIGITDPLVIDQNFRAFDKDKSGMVDFTEYVTALSVFQNGKSEDRLRLLFDIYDTDNSGTLTFDEVYSMYRVGEASKGRSGDHAKVRKLAEDCMRVADTNKDGSIDFDEFKEAFLQKKFCVEPILMANASLSKILK